MGAIRGAQYLTNLRLYNVSLTGGAPIAYGPVAPYRASRGDSAGGTGSAPGGMDMCCKVRPAFTLKASTFVRPSFTSARCSGNRRRRHPWRSNSAMPSVRIVRYWCPPQQPSPFLRTYSPSLLNKQCLPPDRLLASRACLGSVRSLADHSISGKLLDCARSFCSSANSPVTVSCNTCASFGHELNPGTLPSARRSLSQHSARWCTCR